MTNAWGIVDNIYIKALPVLTYSVIFWIEMFHRYSGNEKICRYKQALFRLAKKYSTFYSCAFLSCDLKKQLIIAYSLRGCAPLIAVLVRFMRYFWALAILWLHCYVYCLLLIFFIIVMAVFYCYWTGANMDWGCTLFLITEFESVLFPLSTQNRIYCYGDRAWSPYVRKKANFY